MKTTNIAKPAFIFKASTLQILSALMSEHQWLDLIAEEYKSYAELIAELHRLAITDRYDKLSIRDISKRTGYPTDKVTRFIRKVYDRIWQLNEQQPELFKRPGVRYELQFIDYYQTDYSYFTMWVEASLSHGDEFDWHFVRARQQAYGYYIDHIKHEVSSGQVQTKVTIRSGRFNSYRKMLYDKACFFDLLSIEERFHLSEDQMDRLLIHRVEKDRDGYPESLAYLEKRR